MKLDNFLLKLISSLYPALFFLAPLFFTPINSELFEFNKMILVYVFTILTVGSWFARMILARRILFKRTFLDIPLALFLISQIISTIFSIDRHTSLFGYYSRFNGSLLSTTCYLLLYWAFVSNCEVKDVYKVIKLSLISAAIISIYGILEHFGHSFSCLMFQGKFDVSCWVQKVQERVFATLGQPNWLAAYLCVLMPLTWYFTLKSKIKTQNSKSSRFAANLKSKIFSSPPIYYLLSTIYFLCLLFTQSRSGFLGFLLSFAVFWGIIILFNKANLKPLSKPLILNSLFLILPIIFFGSPFPQLNKYFTFTPSRSNSFTPPTSTSQPLSDTQIVTGGSESGQIRTIVWKGAIEIFKHYPAFGSGVETFAYSYYQYRPMEHNLVSEWDFLYNKAHNEYLNYLATTGIFGLGTYLLFIGSFLLWNFIKIKNQISKIKSINQNLKTRNEKSLTFNLGFDLCILIFALFSGWLSLLVTNFFGFSVVITSLYFFLIPALCLVLSQPSNPSQPPTRHFDSAQCKPTTHNFPFPLLIPLILTSYFLILVINLWRADYHYALGKKLSNAGEYAEAYQQLYQAGRLSPKEPVILDELSTITASLALLSSSSEKNATATVELSDVAIAFSDKASKISPKNLNVAKTRIRVFYTLSVTKSEYLDKAIQTLQEAIKLAPTDPKLVYNLGLLYSKKGDQPLAIETILKSIAMKPDYVDARNALALIYEDAGEKKQALEQLEILKKLAPENASEFQKKIDKLKHGT